MGSIRSRRPANVHKPINRKERNVDLKKKYFWMFVSE